MTGGSGGGLGRRFLWGTLQLGTGSWITYALNFAINIAVARIIGPAELGLYALVFAVNEFLIIVGAVSLNQALIRDREESPTLYNTAFAMAAGLALVGLVIASGLALVLAHYRSSRAGWMLVALGFARGLNLMGTIPQAQMERSLRYGPLAVLHMVTGNLPNLCALGLAWYGLGAWSLGGRDLIASSLILGMSLAWSSHRFRLRFDRESAGRLMSFGRPMFVSRTLDVILQRVDRIAVGSLFGDATLGLYHQANYVATVGQLALRPIFSLSFNLYSRLQDAGRRLARAYGLVNYFIARVLFGLAVAFLIFPEETIRLLMGDEWRDGGRYLRILSVYSVVLPLSISMRQLLFSRGEPIKNVWVRLIQAAVYLPGVAIAGFLDSVVGVAAALVVSAIVAFAALAAFNARIVAGELLSILGVPILASGATWFAVDALRASGALADVPWQLLPALPPALFGLLLLLGERRKLFREAMFVLRQLRPAARGGGGESDGAFGDEG